MSLDGKIRSDDTSFVFGGTETGEEEAPNRLFYNEADMLEDQVLFPEELHEDPSKAPFRKPTGGMLKLEREGLDFERFVLDVDSDLDEFDREHAEYEDAFINDHEHEEDEDEDGEGERLEEEEELEEEEVGDHRALEETIHELAQSSQPVKAMSSLGVRSTADSHEKQTQSSSASEGTERITSLERCLPSKEVQAYLDTWVNTEASYYDDLPMLDQFHDFMDREKAAGKGNVRW